MISRRRFLKNIAAAGSALSFPYIIPHTAFGKQAPSNKINLGCIGVGRMGRTDLKGIINFDDIRVVAVCDVDSSRAKHARTFIESHYADLIQQNKYKGCNVFDDFRELLAQPDIDAVLIVVPDHWHGLVAISACQAGKDIYLEKPMTRTIKEGRVLCDAVNRYGVVLQVGSQQRSDAKFRFACELVRNGYIGQLDTVKVGLPVDPSTTPQTVMPVPPELDYDMWLGPAQWKPYTEKRVHPQSGFGRPGWMRVTDYTAGMITNWGAHHIDIALWGMGDDARGPVELTGKADFPKDGLWNVHEKFRVEYKFSRGVKLLCASQGGFRQGILFEGSEGWVFVRRGFIEAHPKSLLSVKLNQGDVRLYKSLDHQANFIECIKSRKEPAAPAAVGHAANTACLIGEIAMNVDGKLIWDTDKEQFLNNNEANQLVTYPMRSPWHV